MWDKWLYRFVGQDAVFSSDGSRIITITGGMSVWDAKSGVLQHNLVLTDNGINKYSFSDSLVAFVGNVYMYDTLEVWNYYTAKHVSSFLTSPVQCMTFDKKGKYIATANHEKIEIRDAKNGMMLHSFPVNNRHPTFHLSFNADATMLISATQDTVHMWSLKENRLIEKYSKDTSNKSEIPYIFSDKGNTIALHDIQKNKTIFRDITTNKKVGEIPTSVPILAMGIPEKYNCITGLYDNIIRIWDIETGTLMRSFEGFENQIYNIRFNADTTLLIASDYGSVFIWDVKTAELVKKITFENEEYFMSAALFSGTDVLITLSNGEAYIYDWSSEERKNIFKGFWTTDKMICSEIEEEVLIKNSKYIERRKLGTGILSDNLERPGRDPYEGFSVISNDGKYVITTERRGDSIYYSLVNTATKVKLWEHIYDSTSYSVFSKSNNKIAANKGKSIVIIYDTLRNIIQTIDNKPYGVSNMYFDNEGNILFIYGSNITRMWDVNTGKFLHWFNGTATSEKYLNEGLGRLVTVVSFRFDIWDIYTGEKLKTIDNIGNSTSAQYHPTDNEFLVLDEKNHLIKVIDAESGNMLFSVHDTTARGVSYDAKGKFIYSAGYGVNPKLYSAVNGEYLADLVGSRDGSYVVQFSDNGNYVMGIGSRGKLMVWDLRNINTTTVQNNNTQHTTETSALELCYTNKQLTVKIKEHLQVQENYAVYSIFGKKIATGLLPAEAHEFSLTVNNYPNGIYYFEAKINGKSYVQKFSLYQ